jgi:hypothetical protein
MRAKNSKAVLGEKRLGEPSQNEDIETKIKHKVLTATSNAGGGDVRPGI